MFLQRESEKLSECTLHTKTLFVFFFVWKHQQNIDKDVKLTWPGFPFEGLFKYYDSWFFFVPESFQTGLPGFGILWTFNNPLRQRLKVRIFFTNLWTIPKHCFQSWSFSAFFTISCLLSLPFVPFLTVKQIYSIAHKNNSFKFYAVLFIFQPPPPPLYIITPTYRRPEQLAELTRLGYTLKHVQNLFWLVIEDAEKPTSLVTKLLQKINVPFSHLVGT